jgi:hypothetical protein
MSNFQQGNLRGFLLPQLYPRPRLEDAHSGAMCLFPTLLATPLQLSLIQFVKGGEIKSISYLGNLRGFSLPQLGATVMASTAAHTRKTPVLGQRACCPHHGQLPTRSVCSNSRGGEYE